MLHWILAVLLILSSIGILFARKPVHASLCFLLTLLFLSAFYFELSAPFIAVLQVLVYAGGILVLFVFVIVLFQVSYEKIAQEPPKSNSSLLFLVAFTFVVSMLYLGKQLFKLNSRDVVLSKNFGSVQSIGEQLYIDFFFPFEAITFLFLIAIVGAVYIGKRER